MQRLTLIPKVVNDFFYLNESKLSLFLVSAISVGSLPNIPHKQAAHGEMLKVESKVDN